MPQTTYDAVSRAAYPLLYKLARMQLRDDHMARDVVQETLLTGLEKWSSLRDHDAAHGWLVQILRNKIIDHFRLQRRQSPLSAEEVIAELQASENLLALSFDEAGSWSGEMKSWPNPLDAVIDQQALATLRTCCERLPTNMASVFLQREYLGFSSDEICQLCSLTTGNVRVILHRARLALRACMDQHFSLTGDQ
ncbi:sigma-70 family RNA polymerase sigma factor [Chitinimonas sp. PSY-7]|uniref:sigma-70 family RNA polymerase sigma factor n=1 Tax=Chitinimonas sp. PSY-7 TaxID=3459088 RepID=UPI0040403CCC